MRIQDAAGMWLAQAIRRLVSLLATTSYNRYSVTARAPPSEHNRVVFRGFYGPRSSPTAHRRAGGAFLCAWTPLQGLSLLSPSSRKEVVGASPRSAVSHGSDHPGRGATPPRGQDPALRSRAHDRAVRPAARRIGYHRWASLSPHCEDPRFAGVAATDGPARSGSHAAAAGAPPAGAGEAAAVARCRAAREVPQAILPCSAPSGCASCGGAR